MVEVNDINNSREILITKVCNFLNIDRPQMRSESKEEAIKELSVARLCKSVGLMCEYNYKSEFFEFFSSIMGQAVADKLCLNMRIACDDLRLIKYEHKNLIVEVRNFLDYESVDEAFLDAFNLIDDYKYLIPYLKKK